VGQGLAHAGIADEEIARMMKKVIEIEESGLPLIVCVKRPEPVELVHEPRERGRGDIGGEILVSVAAAVINRFCRRTELLSARLGESGLARGSLPVSFVSPCLEARFAAVTALGRDVARRAAETPNA
jgi:hypothetical protein